MSKTPEDALNLFKKMVNTKSLWSNKRAMPRKGRALDIDGLTIMNAKLDTLIKRIDKIGLNAISSIISSFCEFYHGGHPTIKCQQMQDLFMESMNYVGNFNKG